MFRTAPAGGRRALPCPGTEPVPLLPPLLREAVYLPGRHAVMAGLPGHHMLPLEGRDVHHAVPGVGGVQRDGHPPVPPARLVERAGPAATLGTAGLHGPDGLLALLSETAGPHDGAHVGHDVRHNCSLHPLAPAQASPPAWAGVDDCLRKRGLSPAGCLVVCRHGADDVARRHASPRRVALAADFCRAGRRPHPAGAPGSLSAPVHPGGQGSALPRRHAHLRHCLR